MFISVRDVPTLVGAWWLVLTIYRQPKITTHLENSGNCTDMCPPPPCPCPCRAPSENEMDVSANSNTVQGMNLKVNQFSTIIYSFIGKNVLWNGPTQ